MISFHSPSYRFSREEEQNGRPAWYMASLARIHTNAKQWTIRRSCQLQISHHSKIRPRSPSKELVQGPFWNRTSHREIPEKGIVVIPRYHSVNYKAWGRSRKRSIRKFVFWSEGLLIRQAVAEEWFKFKEKAKSIIVQLSLLCSTTLRILWIVWHFKSTCAASLGEPDVS